MRKPKEPVMDWHAIKAEVHRRNMTLTGLAVKAGLHSSLLRKINTAVSYEGQAVLAAFIDQKPENFWPDRYPKKTTRIYDSAKHGPLESQKSNASTDRRAVA